MKESDDAAVLNGLRDADDLDMAASVVDEVADPQIVAPLKVLFVCTANICRSPYMQLATQRLLGDDSRVEVSSAGTHGFTDRPMSEELIGGYEAEAESFRSRRVTGELISEADVILTAEAAHRAYLLEENPAAFLKIFTLGQFAESVARLGADAARLRGRDLVVEVGRHRTRADPTHDVGDPYRRGPEVARACAARIDALLAVVVPALRPTASPRAVPPENTE